MLRFLRHRVIADDRAQDLAEYGIALGLVGALAVAAALAIAVQVGDLWDQAGAPIENVVNGGAGNNGHHHGGGNSGNGGGNGGGNGAGN